MSPSTPTESGYKPPGWWTCHVCVPRVHDRGGQEAFMSHYRRLHMKEKP